MGAAPQAVALRASIVIGARSRSFRFLVRLVERVPVMPLPTWRANRTQPIDGRDVLAYLVAAGDVGPRSNGPLSLDIAGPDVADLRRARRAHPRRPAARPPAPGAARSR